MITATHLRVLQLDLARLTDGLRAERERYFDDTVGAGMLAGHVL